MLKTVMLFLVLASTVQAGQAVADFKQRLQELDDKYHPLHAPFVQRALAELEQCKSPAETKAVFDSYCTGSKSINNLAQPWYAGIQDSYKAARKAEPKSFPQLDPMREAAEARWTRSNSESMGRISARQRELDLKFKANAAIPVQFNAALTKVVGDQIEIVTQVAGPIYVTSVQVGDVQFKPDVAKPAASAGQKVKQRWRGTIANAKKGRATGTASFGSDAGTPARTTGTFEIQL